MCVILWCLVKFEFFSSCTPGSSPQHLPNLGDIVSPCLTPFFIRIFSHFSKSLMVAALSLYILSSQTFVNSSSILCLLIVCIIAEALTVNCFLITEFMKALQVLPFLRVFSTFLRTEFTITNYFSVVDTFCQFLQLYLFLAWFSLSCFCATL